MVWAEMVMGRFGYGSKWPATPPGFYQLKHVKALEEMKTAGNVNKF